MFFIKEKREELADKLSYWALLTLAALLPIIVYGFGEVPTTMTKIWAGGTLVLLAAIFFAVAKMKSQEITVHKSLILVTAWGLPVAYLLSTLFASDTSISLYGRQLTMDSTAFLIVGALALTLTSLVLTDAKRALGLYLAMLGSAAVLTLLELIIFFARGAVQATGIVLPSLSLFGTLNDLAVFFGLITLFVLLALIFLPVSNMIRGILWGTLAVSAFFLAAVNLTVLWWILGGFALAMLVYSLFARFSDDVTKKLTSFAPLAVALFCALFLFGSNAFTSSVATWAQVGELDVRPSWGTTVQIGNQALEGHAIFGAGPDTFVQQWSKYMPEEIAQTLFWQADFVYGIGFVPTSVIATGLVGFLAWLAFFGVFVWYGVRSFYAARRVARGDVVHFLRVTSFVGALYLWVISVIQVPSPALVLYAFILVGIFVAASSWGDDATKTVRVVFKDNPRAGFLVTLGLTFVILLSVGGIYSMTTRHAAEAAYQAALRNTTDPNGTIEDTEKYLQTAINRHRVDSYYRLLSNVDIRQAQEVLNRGEAPEVIRDEFQALLARAVANAQQATIIGSKNHTNWENFGSIYQSIVPLGIEGSTESALAAYDQALTLRPASPQVYLAKATLERQRGNTDAAMEHVTKAVNLRNQYTDAIFLLAQMQLEANNVEEAIKMVEGVTVFEPQNPVAWFQLGLLQYGSDNFTGAVQALERAVALNTYYANARYFLALAYWRLGNTMRAADVLQPILETNAENTEVPAMIENLRAGRDPYYTEGSASGEPAPVPALEGLPIEESAQSTEVAVPEQPATGELTP